jgi:hypothetical protein
MSFALRSRAALDAMTWVVFVAAAAAVTLAAPTAARAQQQTCVEIVAPQVDAEALGRLVRAELDRHTSHRAASQDCQGYLTVELIDLGAGKGAQAERWVTGRINAQVPHREKVGADGLAPAVERLLTVVLHNDPMVLRGPESNTWLAQQKRALERRSATRFGAEVYELGTLLGSGLDTLPGVAVVVRREVSALYVGARVGGAIAPGRVPDRLRLRAQFDAQVELALYSHPAANVSLFGGAALGLVHHRFEGPAPFDGPDATGSAVSTGLSIAVRGGVEAMRTANVRVLAFVQLQVPAFKSEDPDHGVVDRWVPNAALGAGVLF